MGFVPGSGRSYEEEMTAWSSVLALQGNLLDRGLVDTVLVITKESDTTEHTHTILGERTSGSEF